MNNEMLRNPSRSISFMYGLCGYPPMEVCQRPYADINIIGQPAVKHPPEGGDKTMT